MRLSIGKRLLLGFFTLFIVELGIVGLGIFSVQRLNLLNQRNLNLIAPMEATYELLLSFEKLIMPVNDYLTHGNIVEREIFKIQAEKTKKYITRAKEEFASAKVIPEFITSIDGHFQRIKQMADKIFQIKNPISNMEAAMAMEELDAFTDKTLDSIEEYHEEYLDKQLSAGRKEADKIMQEAMVLFLSFSLLALGLSFILSYFLARRVHWPIAALEEGCKKLAQGQIKVKIKINTRDEFEDLARSFNQMVEDLSQHEEEIKKANQELSKWSKLLEARVEERTRELKIAQAQLVQGAKMAAIGQLAGGVAHEINNPLTGVLNNVQLINMEIAEQKDFSPKEFKSLLGTIEESALRCKDIVQALLDFSHLRKKPYQPVNINEVIEKAFILAEHEIRLGNIKIIREPGSSLPKIPADTNQLQQVFLDIFNNAKWAMKGRKDGAELKVKTFFAADNNSVVIEISDNGCGIEEENLEHIFEPFFTTKKPGEGTGLGLSVCYGIVKEHGGIIEVESQGKDKGAAFRITLPLKKEE